MRVGLVMIYHESNTFSDQSVSIEDFRRDTLLTGEAIRAPFVDSHHELGGMFQGLAGQDIEAVPLFAARWIPGGKVGAADYRQLLDMLMEAVCGAGPLDGLLAAPHGASVSEDHDDMDGHWLRVLREQLGPDRPMVSTLDLHANLSSDMVNACDATIPYRTYPHLDQHQRGLDAARLIGQTLRGEIRPVQYGCFPPFAIGIDKQSTSAAPCRGLYELAEQIGQQPRVLNVGIVLGCPYSDVPEMGTAFVVTADGEAELARSCAEKLGASVWRQREQFLIDAPQAEAAVSETMSPCGGNQCTHTHPYLTADNRWVIYNAAPGGEVPQVFGAELAEGFLESLD